MLIEDGREVPLSRELITHHLPPALILTFKVEKMHHSTPHKLPEPYPASIELGTHGHIAGCSFPNLLLTLFHAHHKRQIRRHQIVKSNPLTGDLILRRSPVLIGCGNTSGEGLTFHGGAGCK